MSEQQISVKALREREAVRPESHSVTRFEPFVCVPEDELLALLDAVEAAQDVNTWTGKSVLWDYDDPEWFPTVLQLAEKLAEKLARFDFGSEASR